MALQSSEKLNIIRRFSKHDGDTGSAAVQIALLTAELQVRNEHINAHPKDITAKREIKRVASDRRTMLVYLKRTDLPGYVKIIAELGIREVR